MVRQTGTHTINGVDVEELKRSIQMVADNPQLGRCQFRLENRWVEGGLNHATIRDFWGGGQRISHQHSFELEADEPPFLLGGDQAPNPVEHLLNALAACVTTSLAYHAAARGIELEAVECTVEGDLDLRGFMGISPEVPKGYQDVRVHFRIRANVPDEQLDELYRLGPTFSPVFNTLTQGVPVTVSGARM